MDLVRVSLRFGEETFFIANDRVFVYVPIILDRVRPHYVYTKTDISTTREIFVYGNNYWDTQKPNHLKCTLDGTT